MKKIILIAASLVALVCFIPVMNAVKKIKKDTSGKIVCPTGQVIVTAKVNGVNRSACCKNKNYTLQQSKKNKKAVICVKKISQETKVIQ